MNPKIVVVITRSALSAAATLTLKLGRALAEDGWRVRLVDAPSAALSAAAPPRPPDEERRLWGAEAAPAQRGVLTLSPALRLSSGEDHGARLRHVLGRPLAPGPPELVLALAGDERALGALLGVCDAVLAIDIDAEREALAPLMAASPTRLGAQPDEAPALLASRLVRALGLVHPEAAPRARRGALEAEHDLAWDGFGELWDTNPEAAQSFFWGSLATQDSPTGAAVAALGIIYDRVPDDLDVLGPVLGVCVQKLGAFGPHPLAERVWRVASAIEARAAAPLPLRVQIDLLDAGLRYAWTLRDGGDPDFEPLLKDLEDRILRLDASATRPTDAIRLAVVLGNLAALTGDLGQLHWARRCLELAEPSQPALAERYGVLVLTRFAATGQDPSLWDELVAHARSRMGPEPARAHHLMAVAFAHRGDRATALSHLGEACVYDRRRLLAAFCDPDLEPLFVGAGRADYRFRVTGPEGSEL
ncbi:hypothetical protein L6R46_02485 [Myxococcota bacterium]|nr:hypothetical protein [Myxococcota bacterium]